MLGLNCDCSSKEEIVKYIKSISPDEVFDIMDHYGYQQNPNDDDAAVEESLAEFLMSIENAGQ